VDGGHLVRFAICRVGTGPAGNHLGEGFWLLQKTPLTLFFALSLELSASSRVAAVRVRDIFLIAEKWCWRK
jgi:hypothetical protein